MNVAVIGASRDRSKFGNKAVRAWAAQGHTIFPVNLSEDEIEGWPVFRSLADVPQDLDAVLVYLPPERTLAVLPGIARKGVGELYLNPGTESPEVIAEAERLGLSPLLTCSIVAIGDAPANYGP